MKYEERLKELGVSNLGNRRLERGGTDCIFSFLKGLVVKMEPDSFQSCTVKGQDTMEMGCNKDNSNWIYGKHPSLGEQLSIGTSRQEMTWNIHSWRFSELPWMRPQATWSNVEVGPSLSRQTRWAPELPSDLNLSVILWLQLYCLNLLTQAENAIESHCILLARLLALTGRTEFDLDSRNWQALCMYSFTLSCAQHVIRGQVCLL